MNTVFPECVNTRKVKYHEIRPMLVKIAPVAVINNYKHAYLAVIILKKRFMTEE